MKRVLFALIFALTVGVLALLGADAIWPVDSWPRWAAGVGAGGTVVVLLLLGLTLGGRLEGRP